MSTNYRLDIIEPSAREFEGKQFFRSSEAVSSLARFVSCSLLRPLSSLSTRVKKLSSRRLYKLQAIISGHAVCHLVFDDYAFFA